MMQAMKYQIWKQDAGVEFDHSLDTKEDDDGREYA